MRFELFLEQLFEATHVFIGWHDLAEIIPLSHRLPCYFHVSDKALSDERIRTIFFRLIWPCRSFSISVRALVTNVLFRQLFALGILKS